MIKLKNRGDTIIEVLLAIAVVSSVLGGAYAASSRSLSTTRAAQERSEALKLVEGQIESLKSVAPANPSIFTTSGSFCVDIASAPPRIPLSGPLPALNADNLSSATYPVACQRAPLAGVVYFIAIEPSAPLPSTVFTVHARWFHVNGSSIDEVVIAYKLYQ